MCGIVGYSGSENKAIEFLIKGLSRLEYRGYDSSGIALIEDGKINCTKKKGKLEILKSSLENNNIISNTGIGHTRWATHGIPTDINAHPHLSEKEDVAIVHNGIIDNYISLKNELENEGVTFMSDTDSEVVAQLFSKSYTGDLLSAMTKTLSKIKGSYALAIIHSSEPNKIVVCKNESPLVLGIGENETYIASDVSAILENTRNVIFLEDGDISLIEGTNVHFFNKEGLPIKRDSVKIEWDIEEATKEGYPHFMLKEINEQPNIIEKTLEVYLNENGEIDFEKQLKGFDINQINKIYVVACGTAYHAGFQFKHFMKKIMKREVFVEIASEFRFDDPFIDANTLVVILSQSGETFDTLMGMRHAKSQGAKTLSITNVLGSTISRESDYCIHTLAGPEISVASTKAYTAQAVLMYLFTLYIGKKTNALSIEKTEKYLDDLYKLITLSEEVLKNDKDIKRIAENLKDKTNAFYIGRGIDEKIAREGSLKMKEISYIHTESFPAGELKHGTIALIEEGTVVFALLTKEDMLDKMVSNIKEVKARGAFVISIAKSNLKDLGDISDECIIVPNAGELLTPLLLNMVLQLLAYYTSAAKGYDVDKPRNLAKSVTVE